MQGIRPWANRVRCAPRLVTVPDKRSLYSQYIGERPMRMDAGAIVDALRNRNALPAQCMAALLVGSSARGWSNQKSDIDICLVSAEPWAGPDSVAVDVALEPDVVQWRTFHADNREWDL